MAEEIPPSASPALAEGLDGVQLVTELHSSWETTTLRFMAGHLARGIEADDWPARQQVDLAEIRRELDKTVRRLAEVAGPEIEGMIRAAYERGHGSAPAPARARGLTRRVLDAMRALWARLTGTATRAYRRAVLAGAHAPEPARRAAVQRELDRTARDGLTALHDQRGRALSLVPHVDQTLQTAAGHASMDGYLDRLTDAGEDLVRVTESAHPCPLCVPWENRVLSITGASAEHPGMDVARDAGLWHPRCHHTIERYVPGQPKHAHAVRHRPGTYDQVQRQRAIERHVREWKRREAAALDDVAAVLARRKTRQWQAALRQHIAAHGLQRSRMRERVDFGHTPSLRHALGG